MSNRVEAALEVTSLTNKYSDRLRRAHITDAAVDICLKKSYKNVAQVISCVEDYNLFIQAYLEQNTNKPEPIVSTEGGQVEENLITDHENRHSNPAHPLSGSEDTEIMPIQNSSIGNFLLGNNSDQFNTNQNDTEVSNIVHECYNAYAMQVQQLSVVPSESIINSFLLDEELQNIHKIAEASTLEMFDAKMRTRMQTQSQQELPVNDDDFETYKNELVDRIQQLHQIINSLNSDACKSAIQAATGELEIYLSSLILQETKSDTVWYPDPDPSTSDEFKDLVDDPDDLEFVIVPKSESSRTGIKTVKECEPLALSYFQKLLCLNNVDSCPAAKQAFDDVIQVFKKNQGEQHGVDDQPKTEAVFKTEQIINIHQAWTQYWLEITKKINNTNKYWTGEAINEVQEIAVEDILQNLLVCSKHTDEENHEKLLSDVKSQFLEFKFVDSENEKHLRTQGETDFQKAVDESNTKYFESCSRLVHELVHIYSELLEENLENWPNGDITTTNEARTNFSRNLKFSDGFESLPVQESDRFLVQLVSKMDDSCQRIVDKWYPRKRQMLLQNYKDGVTYLLYGGESSASSIEVTFEEAIKKLNDAHLEHKAEAVNGFNAFLSSVPVLPFEYAKNDVFNTDIEGAPPNPLMPDLAKFFDEEIKTIREALIDNLKSREHALQENPDGYLAQAKLKYEELIKKINQALHNEETYPNWLSAAKEEVKHNFQDQCKNKLVALNRTNSLLLDLDTFMESVSQIKIVDGTAIQISAPSLRFSRDLNSFCAKLNSRSATYANITDVILIASTEIHIDENICGDFWSGKNLAFWSLKKLLWSVAVKKE